MDFCVEFNENIYKPFKWICSDVCSKSEQEYDLSSGTSQVMSMYLIYHMTKQTLLILLVVSKSS